MDFVTNPPANSKGGSALVPNWNAQFLNGQPQSYYRNASNLNAGTVPLAQLGTNAPNASWFLGGDNQWKAVTSTLNKAVIDVHAIMANADQNAVQFDVTHGLNSNSIILQLWVGDVSAKELVSSYTALYLLSIISISANTVRFTLNGTVGSVINNWGGAELRILAI
jgi:hypothetical protein